MALSFASDAAPELESHPDGSPVPAGQSPACRRPSQEATSPIIAIDCRGTGVPQTPDWRHCSNRRQG
jgi:hypothetical protein